MHTSRRHRLRWLALSVAVGLVTTAGANTGREGASSSAAPGSTTAAPTSSAAPSSPAASDTASAGSDTASSGADTASSAAPGASTEGSSAGTAPAPAGNVGELLTLGATMPATGVNPATVNVAFHSYASLAYDSLIYFSVTGDLKPGLAEK